MHTIDDILEILKTSKEHLEPMLEACGWTDQTEFTDEQAETLLAMKASHEEKGRDYVEGYLRNIAHNVDITGTQFDQIHQYIVDAGGSLLDYRDKFQFICTKVKEGADPKNVITATEKGQQTVDDITADYIQHLKDSGDFKKAAIRALDSIPEIVSQRQIGVVAAGLQEFDETIRSILSDPESEYRQKMNAVINGEVINAELGKRSLHPTNRGSLKPASSSSTNSTST